MVHADLNPSNVLVRDGAVVAVVDIGNAGSGTRATDLTTLQWHTFQDPLDGVRRRLWTRILDLVGWEGAAVLAATQILLQLEWPIRLGRHDPRCRGGQARRSRPRRAGRASLTGTRPGRARSPSAAADSDCPPGARPSPWSGSRQRLAGSGATVSADDRGHPDRDEQPGDLGSELGRVAGRRVGGEPLGVRPRSCRRSRPGPRAGRPPRRRRRGSHRRRRGSPRSWPEPGGSAPGWTRRRACPW